MTTYEKEPQLPEALFVARPGYDPGTFPILYRDALTLRLNKERHNVKSRGEKPINLYLC